MNNKIGILTSTPSFINNYGAVLQAYALQTELQKLGQDTYIIKYADEHEYVQGRPGFWARLKGTLLNPHISFQAKYKMVFNKLTHKSVNPVFKKFQHDYIRFFNDEYIGYKGLEDIGNQFSAFITGSDQVWNPNVHHGINDPGYFLQFAPRGVKRIAYAPSIGISTIPDNCAESLKEYLKSFDAISIREESGQRIIKETCGINVPVVLDPTLLLHQSDYDKISDCSLNPKKPYIVCYLFGNIPSVRRAISAIAKSKGYAIVNVPAGLDTNYKTNYSIGPQQFIGLISKAAMVCTDSFHATVFSIIYKRQLLSFCREDEEKTKVTMNSRITGLLKLLELSSAWCGNGKELDTRHIPSIGFELADKQLSKVRDHSIRYLKEALDTE